MYEFPVMAALNTVTRSIGIHLSLELELSKLDNLTKLRAIVE